MINAYDILVNFKKNAYEFYEWEKEDDIKHIKKIPVFKVSNDVITDFLYNDVNVDNDFLNNILNKTEVYSNRKIQIINYACILYCNVICLALIFDSNGNVIGRSKLLFDEADEIIFKGERQKINDIKYSIISQLYKMDFLTRSERKNIDILSKYINGKYKSKKYDELKYIYFECFNKDIQNNEIMYLKLKSAIENSNLKIIDKMNQIIKLLKN